MVIAYIKSTIKAQQSYSSEDITKYPISKNSSLIDIKIQSPIFPKKYTCWEYQKTQMKTQTLQK